MDSFIGGGSWPALAVNYTNKTQYIFRINKGIENSWDSTSLNKFMPNERPIPEKNIIYLGDGETDIPAMKMVNYIGGNSIAVHEPSNAKAKGVCDGHVIIHGAEGLEKIGSDIFEALGIDAMMHLVAPPERILENRLKDAGRVRPVLSEKELEEHQNISLFSAQKVCETLSIPYAKITDAEINVARRFFLDLNQ